MIKTFEIELTSSGETKIISLSEKEAMELYQDLKVFFNAKINPVIPYMHLYPNSDKYNSKYNGDQIGDGRYTVTSNISGKKLESDLSYCQQYNTMSNSEYGC
jgi:hypothetical protein